MWNVVIRWFLWVCPILLLWFAGVWIGSPLPTSKSSHRPIGSFNVSSVYLLISKPQNAISVELIQQLQPATVYVAYPPSEEQHVRPAQQQLLLSTPAQWCPYDPFGDKQTNQKKAQACLHIIPSQIDGVIFNSYGAVGDGTIYQHSGLVGYKLLGNLALLHILLDHGRLKDGARIFFVGSESARGLPKMGFQVPNLGTSIESIQSYLTGSVYSTEVLYRWEQAYADLCAILVLYVKQLAKVYPQYYFGVISPGMTEESLNPNNSPNPSWTWRIQLWSFRNIFFPLLQHWEIAKTAREGASLLAHALLDWEEDYPSGTFVGAKNGTGGPLYDQSLLEGGKMFQDKHLQQITYQAVHPFVV